MPALGFLEQITFACGLSSLSQRAARTEARGSYGSHTFVNCDNGLAQSLDVPLAPEMRSRQMRSWSRRASPLPPGTLWVSLHRMQNA